MSIDTKEARAATLKLTRTADGAAAISARVPPDITGDELAHVGKATLELIHKLTGCQCMSGQYKFVLEDNFLADIMRVNLQTGAWG
jgi:hypothetical protein